MRVALSIILLLHGIAHLPGFVVPWRLTTLAELPYKTTVLGGALDIGGSGVRTVGLLWLLVALGFVAAAVATLRNSSLWPTLTLGVVAFSTALCILGWPDSRIGLAVNLALLALLLANVRFGWI